MDDRGTDQRLLERILEVSEENNKMLRRMRSGMRWSGFFRFVYWMLILASAVASYYYLQPYFVEVQGLWTAVQSGIDTFEQL